MRAFFLLFSASSAGTVFTKFSDSGRNFASVYDLKERRKKHSGLYAQILPHSPNRVKTLQDFKNSADMFWRTFKLFLFGISIFSVLLQIYLRENRYENNETVENMIDVSLFESFYLSYSYGGAAEKHHGLTKKRYF